MTVTDVRPLPHPLQLVFDSPLPHLRQNPFKKRLERRVERKYDDVIRSLLLPEDLDALVAPLWIGLNKRLYLEVDGLHSMN